MTVKELIDILTTMPPDAPTGCLWDGAVRSRVDGVYLAQSGWVVMGPFGEPAYHDEDRPKGAPTMMEDPYFRPIK